jgi:AcrR family transcriptional regulator
MGMRVQQPKAMADPAILDENPYVESIIAAATSLFSARGYRGTSMRHLGDALGLHAGSLYVHIKSKEDVLFKIVDRISTIHEGYMAEILASDAPPVEQLRQVARSMMRLIGENREAATVYFHEWKNLSPERRQIVIDRRDAYEASLRRIIEAAVADGTFRPVDSKLVAFAFVSMFNWSYQWFSTDGSLSAIDVADSYFDFLVRGLNAPPAP